MSYVDISFVSIVVLSLVHMVAERVRTHILLPQGPFLSVGGGVAIAYVFIDLLPKLGASNRIVERTLTGWLPYVERHVFVIALLGFLLFFCIDRVPSGWIKQKRFFFSLGSYALFNFLVGYAVASDGNPEVQPLLLFTIAMALHYCTNDYTLCEGHGEEYRTIGRWALIASLVLGWICGRTIQVSETAIALINAFIGGGVIMNVVRHELPKGKTNDVGAFVLSSALYTAILLRVGG